jgi:LmbE family N-acetylglucosaminyl deacetylase
VYAGKENILVVAAHPDDEALGCGGTIARHSLQGDRVHVIIAAEGVTSRQDVRDRAAATDELSSLHACAIEANKVLGASVELWPLPDNRLDTIARLDLIKRIEEVVERMKPTTVYTHHCGDVNVDHRRVHEAVVTACRPTPGHAVSRLLFFETASSTEWQTPGSQPPFVPNWFVDISATLQHKRRALDAYASEMRAWPHSRSLQAIEYLARWRGASAGVEAAEAFMLGRYIERCAGERA